MVKSGNGLQINHIVRGYYSVLHQLKVFASPTNDRCAFLLLLKLLQQADCFFYALSIDIFKTLHIPTLPQAWTARAILSGVMGSTLKRLPVALKIALAIVATEGVMGGSPTTLPPKGP